MITWVEVDASAIRYNLHQFKKMIGKKIFLMPVIKANAYGHGFLEVAKICNKSSDVDVICVVNDSEAIHLIDNNISKPIMILTFYDLLNIKNLLKLAKKNVIFPVFSLEQAKLLNKVGERAHKKISIHIKIDSGASRVGLLPAETLQFIVKLQKYSNLKISGLFSHFASSEEDRVYTNYQIKNFNKLLGDLESKNILIPMRHFACSSASVLFPQARFDGIRIGLSLYGLYPEELSRKKVKLKPALSWYTKIIQIRNLPPWTKIGYGGSYTTKKSTRIAVLPVGYWDGYDIRFSNNSEVLIGGMRCPVRGRICMNIMMVELPKNLDVRVGDRVTLIGRDKKQFISIDELARKCKTINYEIIARINPLITRKIK